MQILGRSPYSTVSKRTDPGLPKRDDGDGGGKSAAGATSGIQSRAAGSAASAVQQGKQSGEAQGRPAARKPEDLMQHYPDAAQMTQRFELFDERVRWIQRMDDRGGRLSIEESEAVKLHDTLLDRLAFLRAGPVANARIQNPPPETRAEASPGGSAAPKNSEPMVRYIGGVKLKSDYSLQDVLAASANAAKSPFASFIASARDLVKKATEGKALSAEEEEQIYRYAGVVDAFVALTPKGGLSRVAGSVLDGVNQAVDGKDADVDDLREKMVDAYKVVQPKTKAQSGSSRGKLSNVNDSGVASRKETPLIVAVPAFGGSPSRPIDLFDYPRFKIPYGASGFRTSGEERIIRKPAFNAPVKLPDGRTGYLLSPTHPPRLPDDKMHEQEPVAGPSGESTVAEVDSATSSGSDSPVSSRTRLRKWGAGGDLKRIAGKGPINVMPAATPLDDGKRITNFGAPFFFYRKDRDVTDMDGPRAVRGTDYDHRREVLVVGDGTQTTSQIARSKISAGTFWGSGPASHLQGAEVIKLGNGRDGVGAIKLPFASIKPGEAVVVSGGAMNGCTMLFASDGKSLYAYHAGLSQLTPNWRTAREGAQAIVDAHVVMGPKEQIRYKWYGSNDDLITIGRQYPFSALIYNSRDLSGTNALVCAGGLLGCVAGGFDVMPTSHINVPRHAYGPRHGPRWHMMTFDYSEQDPNVRTVGTAEAIVAKDLKGRVTVSVLAEKGKLDRRASFDDRAIPIAYKYKTMDSDSAIYEPKT